MRLAAGLAMVLLAGDARAAGGEETLELAGTLKAAQVASRTREPASSGVERDGESSLWRLRVSARARPFAWLNTDAAWELRSLASSGAARTTSTLLPAGSSPPWRIEPWDWSAGSTERAELRHEVDRASVTVHAPHVDVTVGRQAVGWGRGVLFRALDPFPAFGALEVDREWKRGVDAARVEARVADTVSLEGIAAGGRRVENQVVAARLRGYTSLVDGELAGGRRGTDAFAGGSLSAPILGAEVHAESAVFRAREPIASGGFAGDERLAVLAVTGASYRFDVARGPILLAEWHYSGFGLRSLRDLSAIGPEPDFRARLLRGDAQTLGREVAGAQLAYPWSDELTTAALWLHAPADGSGLAGFSASWLPSDRVSVAAAAYTAYGRSTDGFVPSTEYGAFPTTIYVGVSISDLARF